MEAGTLNAVAVATPKSVVCGIRSGSCKTGEPVGLPIIPSNRVRQSLLHAREYRRAKHPYTHLVEICQHKSGIADAASLRHRLLL
jgi:hypothetical protein